MIVLTGDSKKEATSDLGVEIQSPQSYATDDRHIVPFKPKLTGSNSKSKILIPHTAKPDVLGIGFAAEPQLRCLVEAFGDIRYVLSKLGIAKSAF
jgi:hypothetical protein